MKFIKTDFFNVLKNKKVIRLSIFIMIYIVFLSIFTFSSSPLKYNISVGDIAEQDIYASYDIVDRAATEEKKKEAQSLVDPVYNLDLTVQIQIDNKINYFFNSADSIKNNYDFPVSEKIELIKQQSDIILSDEEYKAIFIASNEDLSQLRNNISYIINQILNQRITESQIEAKKEEINQFFLKLPKKNKLNEIGATIAAQLIRPNMFYDEKVTKAKIDEVRLSVEDIIIKKGTRIVNKGQEVTKEQLRLLDDFGLLKDENIKIDFGAFFAFSTIILSCFYIVGFYIHIFHKEVWINNNTLFLISIISIISIAISVGLKQISGYLMPLPACAMLISVLVSPKIAIIINMVMTILAGVFINFDSAVITTMLLSGVMGAIIVNKTHHRSTFVFAGLGVSLINILIIISFGFIRNFDFKTILNDSVFGLMGGVFSSILAIGSLPFFESTFDLITPIKLLELCNPNQPLLRRLLIEAPGTYYHSILVGNLSEAAAESVGANPLLCRAGAYYHDIGKLKRPYFFKENQLTKDNPHDKITPNLSALIITAHIKDGVEFAKENKLPSQVVDIIRQHHGNTLVAYFYHKALSSDATESVTEDKFRYQNPRPQTKEAAIVMLADSVEAYVRSLVGPTKAQVEQGVRKIINEKLQDKQLSECELTLRDLELIAKAFVNSLAGIFHERIEYPENIKDI